MARASCNCSSSSPLVWGLACSNSEDALGDVAKTKHTYNDIIIQALHCYHTRLGILKAGHGWANKHTLQLLWSGFYQLLICHDTRATLHFLATALIFHLIWSFHICHPMTTKLFKEAKLKTEWTSMSVLHVPGQNEAAKLGKSQQPTDL